MQSIVLSEFLFLLSLSSKLFRIKNNLYFQNFLFKGQNIQATCLIIHIPIKMDIIHTNLKGLSQTQILHDVTN